jgi:hypothetical protein
MSKGIKQGTSKRRAVVNGARAEQCTDCRQLSHVPQDFTDRNKLDYISSPYRAVNILHLCYKNQPVKLYRETIAVCSDIHTKHKYTACEENTIFRRVCKTAESDYSLRPVYPSVRPHGTAMYECAAGWVMRAIFELNIETLIGRQNCNNDGGGGGGRLYWGKMWRTKLSLSKP